MSELKKLMQQLDSIFENYLENNNAGDEENIAQEIERIGEKMTTALHLSDNEEEIQECLAMMQHYLGMLDEEENGLEDELKDEKNLRSGVDVYNKKIIGVQ